MVPFTMMVFIDWKDSSIEMKSMWTSHDVNTHEIAKFSMSPSQRGQVAA